MEYLNFVPHAEIQKKKLKWQEFKMKSETYFGVNSSCLLSTVACCTAALYFRSPV